MCPELKTKSATCSIQRAFRFAVKARSLEHDRPPSPNRRKKEHQHHSSYMSMFQLVGVYCRLFCSDSWNMRWTKPCSQNRRSLKASAPILDALVFVVFLFLSEVRPVGILSLLATFLDASSVAIPGTLQTVSCAIMAVGVLWLPRRLRET